MDSERERERDDHTYGKYQDGEETSVRYQSCSGRTSCKKHYLLTTKSCTGIEKYAMVMIKSSVLAIVIDSILERLMMDLIMMMLCAEI
jgi:hypothetical protein